MQSSLKHLFSIENDIHYLNNAAYGPLPIVASNKVIESIELKKKPYKITPDLHFAYPTVLREQFSRIIGNKNYDRVAIIPAASYGMAIVAANLHRLPNLLQKKSILVLENEFPNTTYAFEKVLQRHNLVQISIKKPAGMQIGKRWNEELMNAISFETAMVVVPAVHWIYGILFNLKKIGERCREVGALLIVDGTQSVGAFPFDVTEIKPDALVCSAYKWLLGPYSIGFGYFGEFFDNGDPIEESWMHRIESNNFGSLTNLKKEYRPLAQRYNMGEFSQFILAPILIESLSFILKLGVESIQKYAIDLSKKPINELKNLGCGIEEDESRAGHLFGLTLPENINLQKFEIGLSERNICISKRGEGLVRVSVNVFNEKADLDALVSLVNDCL